MNVLLYFLILSNYSNETLDLKRQHFTISIFYLTYKLLLNTQDKLICNSFHSIVILCSSTLCIDIVTFIIIK